MKKHSFGSLGPAVMVAFSLLAWRCYEPSARANPTGGSVVQGSASINSSGSHLTVNQSSATTFINWGTFDINNNESVIFNQPSSTSVAWNYIQEPQASSINGNINANGYLILQNPNGFTVGGSAAISAHGLVMTTASTPALNLSSGDAWSFNTPPPTAKIINYGQINITGGGSAYLIASDIENNGTISAKGGRIGLYAGETVLVSTSPNGEGLSAKVTLPQGSVDNEGNLIADGGTIAAQAQTVNQNGLVQANSVQSVNGTIEFTASSSVTLGASSAISATGDSTAASSSPGGSVQIQAGNSFSDLTGSSINVSGAAQGGNGGQISISAPQISTVESMLNGQAAAGYVNGTLSIDTSDIALNSDGSSVAGALALNVNSLSPGFSQIDLQASDDITLNAQWILAPNGGVPSGVSLLAGNEITLDAGSEIEANGGNITLNAPTVNQDATLNADSIGSANGVVEIDASQSLILGADSDITATGDPSTTSPGGFLVLKAANSFADTSGSTISVSGNAGGQDGIIEIFNPEVGVNPIQTTINGTYFAYLVNPYDVTLSDDVTATASTPSSDPNFNVNDLAAYSQIDLQALDDIDLNAFWSLANSETPAVLNLNAANSIILNDGSGINAGNDWNVNLTAGTGFIPTTPQPAPASGSDGIYLNGSAYIQTIDGDINLWAANELQVGWSGSSSGAGVFNPGEGSVTTTGGGNISVNTLYGDVNTGSKQNGFSYKNKAPYYTVSFGLGGISTAAGGNVTINAGGNVTSYLPSPTEADDAGTGAFGPEPANVSITAGGNVYGHYVLANGAGTITAGNSVGVQDGAGTFALSLIDGTWNVNALQNIFLQEVRNPNGDFNNSGKVATNPGWNLFNYAPDATVDLNAGIGVYLTDSNVPRTAKSPVQVIYPPILDISAGSGGVTLDDNVTLFPSADQNLNITTTDGGNLGPEPNGPVAIPELLMSDSTQTRWNVNAITGITAFDETDHGSGVPVQSENPYPAVLDISGNMENLTLITSKETQITVDGDMIDCGFSGQNLRASDITSITVGGAIYNRSSYSFIDDVTIPSVPAADLLPGMGSAWNDIFTLAVDPTIIENLTVPANLPLSQRLNNALGNAGLFDSIQNNQITVSTPNFIYNQTTGQLGFGGEMSQSAFSEFGTQGQPIYILHLVNGTPVVGPDGHYQMDTVNWAPASVVKTLYTDSLGAPDPNTPSVGYRIGGPGQFDIDAGSISLGNSSGILSCGVSDPTGGFARYNNLASITPSGASVNVTVAADQTGTLVVDGNTIDPHASLAMLTSTIAALGGGDVNVNSTGGSMDLGTEGISNEKRTVGYGIFNSGQGDVTVTALHDIDIDGSRIAAYDGGDIFIESLEGNVDVGSGGATYNNVFLSYVDPDGNANNYAEAVYGSGIVANTLVTPKSTASYLKPSSEWPPDHASVPGNITVETPQGDITSTLGGITQVALDGNISGGPTVTLTAGTPAGGDWNSTAPPIYVGNIDLGNSGVIGGTIIVKATGKIKGLVISRQNTSIQAGISFQGTVLSAGEADVSAGGSVSGTIVGVGGASVSGGSVTADVLSQNVSVNGGASQSTLGATATATSTSQSAANQSDSQAKQQLASNDQNDDENKKKKLQPQIRRVNRVTVILPSKT